MSVTTTTHLNFRGTAREALDFYRSVFGGRTVAVTYKDAGAVQDENEADWVMWGEVVSDNGFHVMAYDVPSHLPWNQGEKPFFVSVRGDDTEEISALWGQARRRLDNREPAGARPVGAAVRHAHRPLRHHMGPGRHRCVQRLNQPTDLTCLRRPGRRNARAARTARHRTRTAAEGNGAP